MGLGDRRSGGMPGRGRVRYLRHGDRGRSALVRGAGRRLARFRPQPEPRVLGDASRLRFRHTRGRHRDGRRRHGHPARVVAQAAGHRLPRGAGGGRRRRSWKPPVRPLRDGAEHHLFEQRLDSRHHRDRRAPGGSLPRACLHRPRFLSQGHGGAARHPQPGGGRLYHRAHRDSLRAGRGNGRPGRDRLPQGHRHRRLILGRCGLSEWPDPVRVLWHLGRTAAGERNDLGRAGRDRAVRLHGAVGTPAATHRNPAEHRGAAEDPGVPGGFRLARGNEARRWLRGWG